MASLNDRVGRLFSSPGRYIRSQFDVRDPFHEGYIQLRFANLSKEENGIQYLEASPTVVVVPQWGVKAPTVVTVSITPEKFEKVGGA
jgi:hypothetical protein